MVKLCQWLQVPRSSTYYEPRKKQPPKIDDVLAKAIHAVIEAFPTYGIRMTWSHLRFTEGWHTLNIKRVARVMRLKGWTVHKRVRGGKPRVKIKSSKADTPNTRWATDLASVFCGAKDGWCSFVPIVDCCTREILGWELDRSARAKTAERALEDALLARFGTTHGAPEGMLLRHDNGLVFGSKLYRRTAKEYGLQQEFITPYTPQENGLCERLIRTAKEECFWQHQFTSLEEARAVLAAWIEHYNHRRPHSSLRYQTPSGFHAAFERRQAA